MTLAFCFRWLKSHSIPTPWQLTGADYNIGEIAARAMVAGTLPPLSQQRGGPRAGPMAGQEEEILRKWAFRPRPGYTRRHLRPPSSSPDRAGNGSAPLAVFHRGFGRRRRVHASPSSHQQKDAAADVPRRLLAGSPPTMAADCRLSLVTPAEATYTTGKVEPIAIELTRAHRFMLCQVWSGFLPERTVFLVCREQVATSHTQRTRTYPVSCRFFHTYLDFHWEKQSVLFVEDMMLCLTEC